MRRPLLILLLAAAPLAGCTSLKESVSDAVRVFASISPTPPEMALEARM